MEELKECTSCNGSGRKICSGSDTPYDCLECNGTGKVSIAPHLKPVTEYDGRGWYVSKNPRNEYACLYFANSVEADKHAWDIVRWYKIITE